MTIANPENKLLSWQQSPDQNCSPFQTRSVLVPVPIPDPIQTKTDEENQKTRGIPGPVYVFYLLTDRLLYPKCLDFTTTSTHLSGTSSNPLKHFPETHFILGFIAETPAASPLHCPTQRYVLAQPRLVLPLLTSRFASGLISLFPFHPPLLPSISRCFRCNTCPKIPIVHVCFTGPLSPSRF
jgi:hypothetical protein